MAAILRGRYGDHAHFNRKNPLDERLFIFCSTKTQESSYLGTYAALREEFSTFSRLAEAPAEFIARPLVPGGLHRQKSVAIRKTCNAIIERFGRLTLAPLQGLDDAECEAFLTSLPGVGKKVARCVMMYSLGRLAFRRRSREASARGASFFFRADSASFSSRRSRASASAESLYGRGLAAGR